MCDLLFRPSRRESHFEMGKDFMVIGRLFGGSQVDQVGAIQNKKKKEKTSQLDNKYETRREMTSSGEKRELIRPISTRSWSQPRKKIMESVGG